MSNEDFAGLDPALVEVLGKARVLDELYENPKTKMELFKLLKQNNPKIRVPEIDAPNETLEAIKPALTEIKQTRDELEKERVALQVERARENLKRKHNLTDEELADTGKYMQEKGITNVDTALEHKRLAAKVAAPRSAPNGGTIQLPNMTEIFADPKGWALNEAHKTIDEIEQNRR